MDYPRIHKFVTRKQVPHPTKIVNNGFFLPNQENKHFVTFHAVMKPIVILGQLFSLNPVIGVCHLDASKLRFTYFSGRCAYTIVMFISQATFFIVFFIIKLFEGSNNLIRNKIMVLTRFVYFLTTTLTTILFLRVATKWPKLCRYIANTEVADPLYDPTLKTKCNLSCILILVFGLGEYMITHTARFVVAADCDPERPYQKYITENYPWIDAVFPYNHIFGVLLQLLIIQCKFSWNYMDLFVICISFYLTSRLEQLNRKLAAARGLCLPQSFWRVVREDYSRLTSLVKRVDDVIGAITCIVFANDTFYVCLQLLHFISGGLKVTPSCSKPDKRLLHGYEYAVYHTYSLVFLILRSIAVSLIASSVNTASLKPLSALYEVSSKVYGIETQRLIEQIHGNTVALTGLEFFKIRRGILLAIAGTIVTYELVLIQITNETSLEIIPHNTTK